MIWRMLWRKPGIDGRDFVYFSDRHTISDGIPDVPEPLPVRGTELVQEQRLLLAGECPARFVGDVEEPRFHAGGADFEGAKGLLERLLEGAADGHNLTHRLHLGRESCVGGREFSKVKRGILVTT